MTPTYKESASDREILLVGPYGVLGTGVIDVGISSSRSLRKLWYASADLSGLRERSHNIGTRSWSLE